MSHDKALIWKAARDRPGVDLLDLCDLVPLPAAVIQELVWDMLANRELRRGVGDKGGWAYWADGACPQPLPGVDIDAVHRNKDYEE